MELNIQLKYQHPEYSYIKTYNPDFYLPDIDVYIEIKGRWWKSKDGKIDDKKKMYYVFNSNPDKCITIITKPVMDLIDLIFTCDEIGSTCKT